ncbi:hypothetical protein ACFYSC_10860 [Streptosporangium sp. NPDC004379]|uniref:hypothetical protein n=1 Tax=Streptosporangium sp. NPDC004379 TaxID=3366189 RepID=UPI0036822CCC
MGIGHHVLDADRFAELVLNEPGPLPDDVIPPPKWERIRSWFGAGPPDDPRPSG